MWMLKYIPKAVFPQTMYVHMKIFTWYDIHQSRGGNSKAITQLMCQVEGAIQTLPSLPIAFWTTVKQIFIDDGFSTEAMIIIRIGMTHNCIDISELYQSELGFYWGLWPCCSHEHKNVVLWTMFDSLFRESSLHQTTLTFWSWLLCGSSGTLYFFFCPCTLQPGFHPIKL